MVAFLCGRIWPHLGSGFKYLACSVPRVERHRARNAKLVCFGEWEERRWGLLLLFLLSFSLFPIFLSGVGVRVSVLGLGFFPSPD